MGTDFLRKEDKWLIWLVAFPAVVSKVNCNDKKLAIVNINSRNSNESICGNLVVNGQNQETCKNSL